MQILCVAFATLKRVHVYDRIQHFSSVFFFFFFFFFFFNFILAAQSENIRVLTSINVPSDRTPIEDSDQPAHSYSLIRIFTGRILDSQGCNVLLCGQ